MAKETIPDLCFFCGNDLSTAGRAREHVLPQWLLRHYGIERAKVEPSWTGALDSSLRDQRSHPLKAMVLGHVCAACNNGWMSALEVAARPTLLDLAEGRLRVSDLSPQPRTLVARWALKTVAALNASSNFHRLVTQDQAAATRTDQLPDGVVVLAHVLADRDERDDFWWLQHNGIAQMLNPREGDDLAAVQDGAWRCFLGFDRLCLLVAYAQPSPEWAWFRDPRWGAPIWPLEGTWHQRPSSSPAADDVRTLSMWMSLSIGLCRADDLRGIESTTIESWS